MSVYLVTWDLNKEGAAYSQARAKLISVIEKLDSTYISSLDSVRFISTTMNANQLYMHLTTNGGLDTNDTIVVVQMRGKDDNTTNDGNLGKAVWDWINARI